MRILGRAANLIAKSTLKIAMLTFTRKDVGDYFQGSLPREIEPVLRFREAMDKEREIVMSYKELLRILNLMQNVLEGKMELVDGNY